MASGAAREVCFCWRGGAVKALLLALLVGGMLARAQRVRREGGRMHDARDMTREQIMARIIDTARACNVPPHVALATAWLESRFEPQAEGDLRWHENQARFDAVVPPDSPFRAQPELWHSYGLFQLLAPYHVRRDEDPRILLKPALNIERGVAFLGRLLKRAGGDVDRVRLLYTGAVGASPELRAVILERWHEALARFSEVS